MIIISLKSKILWECNLDMFKTKIEVRLLRDLPE